MDWGDLPRGVLATGENNAWGVELRVASKDGKTIAYLVNLNKHDVEIVLRTKAGTQEARDLITNEIIELNGLFVLKPRTPMLLEWK